jgi:hypothetical protein
MIGYIPEDTVITIRKQEIDEASMASGLDCVPYGMQPDEVEAGEAVEG